MTVLRWRFLWPVTVGTLCLLALCVFTAVSLFHQQATITVVLRENVSSRRSAADLRGCLNTLIELETHHVDSVADLHTRAQTHLQEIGGLANYPEEKVLSGRLNEGFAQYIRRWQALPPPGHREHEAALAEATRFLETHVLLPCREIEAYNDRKIEETTSYHERVLNQLAWGMAGVGGFGGVAGVVLGFGVARALSRSIRRLHVQLRDAAGKIGPELPEIVLTDEDGFGRLHGEIDRLSDRIEKVVQELHDREREVVRAEQLAAVGQLAAGVGHEIRNPLTSIKMLVQSGLEDGDRPGLIPEDLQVIEGEIRRMERSLQTFLDFARPPKPERRVVDLLTVVDTVFGLVRGRAEKQRVATKLDAPHGPVTLTADAGQLQQVLVNLSLNALDAMPAGGTLSVTIRAVGERVEVEVSDTGPGVPKSVMPRLFQPFVTTKDTGLGLGLVISRRIVEDHGGTIGAANRLSGGATFFLRLPIGG